VEGGAGDEGDFLLERLLQQLHRVELVGLGRPEEAGGGALPFFLPVPKLGLA
jgi:hypothetical protein